MRHFRPATLLLLFLAHALACGDGAEREPAAGMPVATPPGARPSAAPGDTVDAALIARGRAVHDAICAECHAIESPPVTAPTLREISDRYREAYLDHTEALEHLADYIREPSPAKSQLPQVMIDEWGVMPSQALPPEDLSAAAYFIWHLDAARQ